MFVRGQVHWNHSRMRQAGGGEVASPSLKGFEPVIASEGAGTDRCSHISAGGRSLRGRVSTMGGLVPKAFLYCTPRDSLLGGIVIVGRAGGKHPALSAQERQRIGSSLIRAGAAVWLLHSILTISGVLLGRAIAPSFDPRYLNDVAAAVLVWSPAFLPSLASAAIASLLLGIGLLVLQRLVQGPDVRTTTRIRVMGFVCAALLLSYGVLASAVPFLLLSTPSSGSAIVNAIHSTLILWVTASTILLVSAAILSSFLRSSTGGIEGVGGPLGPMFLAYSILNMTGVVLFAGLLLYHDLSPQSSPGLIAPILVGGTIALLVAPAIGSVASVRLAQYARRIRGA